MNTLGIPEFDVQVQMERYLKSIRDKRDLYSSEASLPKLEEMISKYFELKGIKNYRYEYHNSNTLSVVLDDLKAEIHIEHLLYAFREGRFAISLYKHEYVTQYLSDGDTEKPIELRGLNTLLINSKEYWCKRTEDLFRFFKEDLNLLEILLNGRKLDEWYDKWKERRYGN